MTEDPNNPWRQTEGKNSTDPSSAIHETRPLDVVRKGKEVEIHQPGQLMPGGGPTVVVMSRRTVSMLTVLILVLAIFVAGLLYVVLGHKDPGSTPVAAASTTSQSPTPSDQSTTTSSPTTSGPSSELSTSTPTDEAASTNGTPGPTPTGSTSANEQAATPSSPSGTFSAAGPATGDPSYLGAPVDGGGYVQTGQDVQIDRNDYPQSVTFYCPASGEDWNVAGSSSFSATFGIIDGAEHSVGVVDTIKFTDENGRILNTSKTQLGQPQKITFSVKGVERLVMVCTQDGSYNNKVALGNASTIP